MDYSKIFFGGSLTPPPLHLLRIFFEDAIATALNALMTDPGNCDEISQVVVGLMKEWHIDSSELTIIVDMIFQTVFALHFIASGSVRG